jgi:hypothetical protein
MKIEKKENMKEKTKKKDEEEEKETAVFVPVWLMVESFHKNCVVPGHLSEKVKWLVRQNTVRRRILNLSELNALNAGKAHTAFRIGVYKYSDIFFFMTANVYIFRTLRTVSCCFETRDTICFKLRKVSIPAGSTRPQAMKAKLICVDDRLFICEHTYLFIN